jgi:hypothetical protein
MTTRPKDVVHDPQDEVVFAEPQIEVSPELHQMVDEKMKNLVGVWKERKEARTTGLKSAGVVTTPGNYQYWNCLLLGPYQKSTMDRPMKIIAADEPAVLIGVIWVNPEADPDGGVSGTEFMAGRPYRACFRAIGISDTLDVVTHKVNGVFQSLADEFTFIEWNFPVSDPGDYPKEYEVHLSVDLAQSGLRFATFATYHWDPEGDEAFPGMNRWTTTSGINIGAVPSVPRKDPHFDHDIPARFLVYRKNNP